MQESNRIFELSITLSSLLPPCFARVISSARECGHGKTCRGPFLVELLRGFPIPVSRRQEMRVVILLMAVCGPGTDSSPCMKIGNFLGARDVRSPCHLRWNACCASMLLIFVCSSLDRLGRAAHRAVVRSDCPLQSSHGCLDAGDRRAHSLAVSGKTTERAICPVSSARRGRSRPPMMFALLSTAQIFIVCRCGKVRFRRTTPCGRVGLVSLGGR